MGFAEVIESTFKVNGKLLKLYDYQIKWCNDNSRFRIVNKSRQTGFSFICAAEALVKAMFVPDSVILFVSTDQKGADRLMRYVKTLWRSVDQKIRDKLELDADSKSELSFVHNNSRIISLPNSANAVRGYPATDIYLDEFAFHENEEELWKAILPSIIRGDIERRISLVSTPNGILNNFYKICVELVGDENDNWSRHHVPWTSCPDVASKINDIRVNLSPLEFKQEFCCEFLSEATSALPLELIMACVDESLKKLSSVDHTHNEVFAGIDFGKKRDSTAVVLFEKFLVDGVESIKMLNLYTMTRINYNEQLKIISGILKRFRVVKCWVDGTGVGEKLGEDMQLPKNCGTTRVISTIFTNKWKESQFSRLAVLMQQGRIKLLNDEVLIHQFVNLERKITIHNNVRYEHKRGEHDDIFMACLLLIECMNSKRGTGFVFGASSAWN